MGLGGHEVMGPGPLGSWALGHWSCNHGSHGVPWGPMALGMGGLGAEVGQNGLAKCNHPYSIFGFGAAEVQVHLK